MATKPRKASESGFYHVFHRGVNHFDIFENDDDREFYLDRMQHYARKTGVEVHAWCLMSNHTHLLLRGELRDLSTFMRNLGSVYARYFNAIHERSGPLFGSRFSSVCIETEEQVLAVARYLHRNPVYHDETALFTAFRWSSYREYVAAAPRTCRIDCLLPLFGSVNELVRFHETMLPSDLERHLDLKTAGSPSDDEARKLANAALGDIGIDVGVSQIGALPRSMRDKALAYVKRATGCSARQLQRLTSIAYSVIRSVIGMPKENRRNCEQVPAAGFETACGSRAVKGIGFFPTSNPLPHWTYAQGC